MRTAARPTGLLMVVQSHATLLAVVAYPRPGDRSVYAHDAVRRHPLRAWRHGHRQRCVCQRVVCQSSRRVPPHPTAVRLRPVPIEDALPLGMPGTRCSRRTTVGRRSAVRPGQSRCGGALKPCRQTWPACRNRWSAAHGPDDPTAQGESLTRGERQRGHGIHQRHRSLPLHIADTTQLVSGVPY